MSQLPNFFPPRWASCFGDDEFGLWVEIRYKGASQRLRWLEPGEFWMGSSETEGGRHQDEGPQHAVRLTEGFWLANSACTQAFWMAVVDGKNPSRFQGDLSLPVEYVSWGDISQKFLPRLQKALGDAVKAQLPSEAQWEYACRAGTTTPFFFGETIMPEQVNYDGNHPYGKGKKGLDRNCTVPVASLPANAWGFYEMHGNVWEWCRDGLRSYDSNLVLDPEGPQDALRVLRGGSWFRRAAFARSACRNSSGPGRRSDYVGFRFGLRPLRSG